MRKSGLMAMICGCIESLKCPEQLPAGALSMLNINASLHHLRGLPCCASSCRELAPLAAVLEKLHCRKP
jgi:hypothetical protein